MFGKKNCLEVVNIQGVISATTNGMTDKYKHYDILDTLFDIENDDKTKGVLLKINSPGGTAGASLELAMSIERVAKVKPVVAHVSDTACSGALMAAVAANKIVASPMAMIGSIGVIMQIPDLKSVADKIGFGMRTIKSASMKDIGNPFREMTDEEKSILQDSVNENHEYFKQFVESKRKTGCIDAISDGRFFNATQALECRLIDKLGTYADAMRILIEMANVKDYDWVERGNNEGVIDFIFSKLESCLVPHIRSQMMTMCKK